MDRLLMADERLGARGVVQVGRHQGRGNLPDPPRSGLEGLGWVSIPGLG